VKGKRDFNPDDYVIAKGDDLHPDKFPELGNISAAFIFQFIPRPKKVGHTEFAYIRIDDPFHRLGENYSTKASLTVAWWNIAWEAGQLRSDFIPQSAVGRYFPKKLNWQKKVSGYGLR